MLLSRGDLLLACSSIRSAFLEAGGWPCGRMEASRLAGIASSHVSTLPLFYPAWRHAPGQRHHVRQAMAGQVGCRVVWLVVSMRCRATTSTTLSSEGQVCDGCALLDFIPCSHRHAARAAAGVWPSYLVGSVVRHRAGFTDVPAAPSSCELCWLSWVFHPSRRRKSLEAVQPTANVGSFARRSVRVSPRLDLDSVGLQGGRD